MRNHLLAENTNNPDVRFVAARIEFDTALLHDDAKGAAEVARQFAENAQTPNDQYNAACLYGLCLKAIEKNDLETEEGFPDNLRRSAVELLTGCCRQMGIPAEKLAKDSDLDALRGDPDFDELVKQLKNAEQK